jgi:hypothetical protein
MDQVGRAYGVLTHAHSISSKEALNLLSVIRLGIDLGFLPEEGRILINSLLMETQPAHLQHLSQQKLAAEERDQLRADIVREKLKNFPKPNKNKLSGDQPPRLGNANPQPLRDQLRHECEKTVSAVMAVFADGVRTWAVMAVYLCFSLMGENVLHYFDPNGHRFSHIHSFKSYLDEGFLVLAWVLPSISLCHQLVKIYFGRRRTNTRDSS